MRLLYTIDLYLNAFLQIVVDALRTIKIHPVWLRITALITSTYFLLQSAVSSTLQGDTVGLILSCMLVVCPLMFLTFNVFESFLVLVGDHDAVDEGRKRMLANHLNDASLTVRPFYLIGATLLLATSSGLSVPVTAFTIGFLCMVLDLYLETCV